MINAVISTVGSGPSLLLYTGTPPVNCAATSPDTLLATIVMPSSWTTAAAEGVTTLEGLWQAAAVATGTIGYYRIVDASGSCCEQGTVSVVGGGGDLLVDNAAVVPSQIITVIAKTVTAGNA